MQQRLTPDQALQELKDGNKRFVNNLISIPSMNYNEKRQSLENHQNPFAIILSCSDSRVPSEIIFNQSLGDLFIIRVAGNIVAPSLLGSIEFAVTTFNTPLVVVMGHTECGAVAATIKNYKNDVANKNLSPNIKEITNRIEPSIEPLINSPLANNQKELLDKCIDANVFASASAIKASSEIIKNYIAQKKIKLVCAKYSLKSGLVEFFDTIDMSNQSDQLIKSNIESVKSTTKTQTNVVYSHA